MGKHTRCPIRTEKAIKTKAARQRYIVHYSADYKTGRHLQWNIRGRHYVALAEIGVSSFYCTQIMSVIFELRKLMRATV